MSPSMTRRRQLDSGVEYSHTFEFLAAFSYIGPAYPRGSKGTLREIVVRPYRVSYDVSEESQSVEILHVWHGARDAPTFQNR